MANLAQFVEIPYGVWQHAATHRMEFQVILMTIVVMYIGTESIPLMMVLLWTETCRVE